MLNVGECVKLKCADILPATRNTEMHPSPTALPLLTLPSIAGPAAAVALAVAVALRLWSCSSAVSGFNVRAFATAEVYPCRPANATI